jgi:hypothetical protein
MSLRALEMHILKQPKISTETDFTLHQQCTHGPAAFAIRVYHDIYRSNTHTICEAHGSKCRAALQVLVISYVLFRINIHKKTYIQHVETQKCI